MKPEPSDPLSDRCHKDDVIAAVVQTDHLVVILDDDFSVLASLERLLTGRGFRVRLHASPEEFFQAGLPEQPACLLLDNQLGDGMSGVEVHAEIARRGWELPTVFVTAHWNVQSVVHAMRTGADGYLTKPYNPVELMDAVARALQRAIAHRRTGLQSATALARVASLTTREREIVRLVLTGSINKEIADRLNLSLVTVKVHRGRAMRKLGAGNAVELARIAALAGVGC